MTQTPQSPSDQPWQDPQRAGGPSGSQPASGPQAYGQPSSTPPGPGAPSGAPQGDERTMMLLAHLSGPIAMLFSAGWLPFLGPLLIWLFYKDRSSAVRTASAGAFNFNLSLGIASIVLWISVILTLGIGFLWAIPGWIVIVVIQLWCHIKGALRAADGRVYDYPLQLRLLS